MVPSLVIRLYDSALAGVAVAIAVVTARKIRARPGAQLLLSMGRLHRKSDTGSKFPEISTTLAALARNEPGKSATRQIHLRPEVDAQDFSGGVSVSRRRGWLPRSAVPPRSTSREARS